MINIYKQIFKEIEKNDKIIITTHVRADGDCVGSAIGLKEIIKSMYKDKSVKVSFENMKFLSFLGSPDKIEEDEFKDALIISVDNASLKRSNDSRITLSNKIIKIDHHPNKEPFGYINLVDENRCACAEIIFDFLSNIKNPSISVDGLEALCTGILTDSGRLSYSHVDSRTFMTIGKMIDMGIDYQKIVNHLDETSKEELRFKGYVLSNFEETENGVLYIKITKEMRDKYNVSYDEASNMVSELSGVKESPIWVLFNEAHENEIRCRVRSNGIKINETCEKFGGGGHENASGIVVDSFEKCDEILNALDELLKKTFNV